MLPNAELFARIKKLWMVGLFSVAAVAPATNQSLMRKAPAAQAKLPIYENRVTSEDLAISGNLTGLPPGSVRYVAYSDLLKLPQVRFQVTDDPNFHEKTEIDGVYLESLLRALDIPDKDTLIAAICDDKYEAHYPAAYRATHHPILVLRINGRQPAQWPRSSDGGTYGPYLISHASFAPQFKVLAYAEESQIPNGVLELRFLKEDEVLAEIHPRGNFAADSPQMKGGIIARENCLRCHNSGPYGGDKAGRSWEALGRISQTSPSDFARYIKDPKSVNGLAQMPGFPEYDEATLAALAAYFQTFAPAASAR